MKKKNSQRSKRQTSARKAAANERNAQKSTGPRSLSGKLKSSQNALKFGFYATAALLPGEDADAYRFLREQLWANLGPQTCLEGLCVSEVINTLWRLRRLGLIEGEILFRESFADDGKDCGVGFAFLRDSMKHNAFSKLGIYEAALSRRLYKALEQLRLAREKGWQEFPAYDAPETGDIADPNPTVAAPISAEAESAAGAPGETPEEKDTDAPNPPGQQQAEPTSGETTVSSAGHDHVAPPASAEAEPGSAARSSDVEGAESASAAGESQGDETAGDKMTSQTARGSGETEGEFSI